jgi:hypothetical protein
MCQNSLNYLKSEIKRRKLFRRTGILLALVICNIFSYGQEISVTGLFLNDTIKVGEEVPYSLSVSYPRSYNIIFPDSTYNFHPFEYHYREYYKTVSDSMESFDSVIYHLSTFEIDTIQFLQLPIFINQDEDSAAIYTTRDSVTIFHIIQEMPDSVKLKENTTFLKIPKTFNYPIFLIVLGILMVLLIAGLLFFGKRLTRWIKIMIMRRNHKRFVNRFYIKLGGLRDHKAGVDPEGILADWKKYMEKLEKEPYTKLTSKELIGLHADQRLKDNLRSIDRYIYGNIKEKPLHEHFEKLLEYSIERYDVRLNELRNG